MAQRFKNVNAADGFPDVTQDEFVVMAVWVFGGSLLQIPPSVMTDVGSAGDLSRSERCELHAARLSRAPHGRK